MKSMSRLGWNSLTKIMAPNILATENSVEAANGSFSFKRVDEVTVRGRKAPTALYTIAKT